MSPCVFPFRNCPLTFRSSALACSKHFERFLQCFLFFLRFLGSGGAMFAKENCPLLRIVSSPEGLREEILPPEVTLISGSLTIWRKSSAVIDIKEDSNSAFARASSARRSSSRSLARSRSYARRSSSRSRVSKRSSRRESSRPASLRSKSSRSKEYSTKGITLKRIELRSEQVQRKCQQMQLHGIRRSCRSCCALGGCWLQPLERRSHW